MPAIASKPALIQKEEIDVLKFPTEDVLMHAAAIKQRKEKLHRATALGNIEHNKCQIIFEDLEGLKMVETTIWATGERNIVLKKGVIIPIHCIHQIIL